MLQVEKARIGRVRQGDLIRDVDCIETVTEQNGVLSISLLRFPLVYVSSQDCDLEQETKSRPPSVNNDKHLISVLVCPVYNLEHFFLGEHLKPLGLSMEKWKRGKSPASAVQNNTNPRYHFLDFGEDVPIVPSIIDFKHFFSMPVHTLETKKASDFVCSVSPIFREDVSQRFASYFSRIGLP